MTRRVTTIPTVGFNVETVTYKNVRFNVWVSIEITTLRRTKGLINFFRMSAVKIRFVRCGDTITQDQKD